MNAHRWAVLAFAFALAAPAPAAAAKSPKVTYRFYRVTAVTGTERVDFAGDAAAGCAARGACGIAGSQTFTPDAPGPDSVAIIVAIGGEDLGSVELGKGTTTASVTTAGADAACTDTLEVDNVSAALGRSGSGWLAVLHAGLTAPGVPTADAAVFATHCAGPRTADLAASHALPRATLSKASAAHKKVVLDLATDRAFSGSGFAGHVTADIKVTLRRARFPKAAADVLPTTLGKR